MALINDDQQLIGASRNVYDIPVYDDGFGQLYIHRDSMGISGIVRAQSWYDAYGICEDEFFPDCEETEAGLTAEFGPQYWENACFAEQYGYRPNGVSSNPRRKSHLYVRDLNGDSLDVLTPELAEELGITLNIQPWEN